MPQRVSVPLRRFQTAVVAYLGLCLVVGAGIVLHGDGRHPYVASLVPPHGDRYFPGGPVQIGFSQAMDSASVERALHVSPAGQGQGVWYGNVLNIQPVGDWRPNVTYRVSLVGAVSDAQGRPLRTPFTFSFRVHHVARLGLCRVHTARTLCDASPGYQHVLLAGTPTVLSYALSSDGTQVAFIRRDRTGVPHLYVLDLTSMRATQLTYGVGYTDSRPFWGIGEESIISYYRRPVRNGRPVGSPQLWTIATDGSANSASG